MHPLSKIQAAVGPDVVLGPHDADLSRHLADFSRKTPAHVDIVGVAYPRNTQHVSAILRICHELSLSVVPQGGLTGISGGAVAMATCLILSLERMRAIEEIDQDASTLTVQAGVPLEAAQRAASEVGLFFPVDWGARGSAQIGGGVSTNAGGNRVLRFGMMRDSVLGLEVVLADGTVITSLNKMIKNNAGYDLKQLFIGSEGTLGVVTRVVLKLLPLPSSVCTCLVALETYDQVLALLRSVRREVGGGLSAFEVMWREFYSLGTTALGHQPPIPEGHGIYVLIETMGTDHAADREKFEGVIGAAMEAGIVVDAVFAQSDREAQSLWSIRECPSEFSKVFAPQVNFDVSAPTGGIAALKADLESALRARWPGIQLLFFGHVADSNLHFAARLHGREMPEHDIESIAYEIVGRHGGSISAEHGIGSVKREFLHHSRTPAEISLMSRLKVALDPRGILNPGKVI